MGAVILCSYGKNLTYVDKYQKSYKKYKNIQTGEVSEVDIQDQNDTFMIGIIILKLPTLFEFISTYCRYVRF